jgi:hypothetical protein
VATMPSKREQTQLGDPDRPLKMPTRELSAGT